MPDAAKAVVTEPEVDDARHYAARAYQLALAYSGLFIGSLIGIGLIVWKAQLFVSLTQRSNVETLTLAFFMVFFAYVAVISRAGFVGALRIAYYELLPRIGRERLEVERRKIRALGERGKSPPTPR